MPQINKRLLAEQELLNIWVYTNNEWGEDQADKYLDDIEGAMNILAEQPLLCRAREEFKPPVRIHHFKHHLIVYITMDQGIEIIRVLHENMDPDTQFVEGT